MHHQPTNNPAKFCNTRGKNPLIDNPLLFLESLHYRIHFPNKGKTPVHAGSTGASVSPVSSTSHLRVRIPQGSHRSAAALSPGASAGPRAAAPTPGQRLPGPARGGGNPPGTKAAATPVGPRSPPHPPRLPAPFPDSARCVPVFTCCS